MKTYFIFFITFFILLFTFFSNNINTEEEKLVMADVRTYNQKSDEYHLSFDNEILNLSNFKLKMAIFSSYPSNIKRVYINYPVNIKDYFKDVPYISVTGNNLNNIIEQIKDKYNSIIEENNIYPEYNNTNIIIKRVVLESNLEAIDRFKSKYENVIVEYK